MANVLVTQSFGNENEYRRAIFAIWSYWRFRPGEEVILFTDTPAFFAGYFNGQPIHYVLLTPQKVKEMRGEINFLHRMKIALIDEAFQLANGNLMYIDSDTFFWNDPTRMLNLVSQERAYMHVREYRFDSLREMKLPAGKTFHDFLGLIDGGNFRGRKGLPISVTPLQYSWNAGAMILHKTHRGLLGDVYALTDQFYPPTLNHASEQYAFSIVLQENTLLHSCDAAVYHYWHRVKKQIVDIFLAKRINNQWAKLDTSEKKRTITQWTETLPAYFDSHILTLRDNAIQEFNRNLFAAGWKWAIRALMKQPFDKEFLKHLLYHGKRNLKGVLGI